MRVGWWVLYILNNLKEEWGGWCCYINQSEKVGTVVGVPKTNLKIYKYIDHIFKIDWYNK